MAVDENKIKKIQERYLDLPEDVQKALFSTQTSDAIFEVGKKHGLAIDKMGELADETGLVMLGMTKPSEYIRNLEKRLSVEVTKAKEIAEDINQKVFSPIRESLKKIHGITPTPTREGARGEGVMVPENLPVEITPSLLTKEEGLREEVKEKVEQILKNHEAAKQSRKVSHVMPPQPPEIKVGEIAKPTEPRVEIKPMISGRIDPSESKITAPLREISGQLQGVIKESTEPKTEVPNIFLKKIPFEKPKIEPDFIPLPKEQLPQGLKEAKNLLEQELAPNKPIPPKKSEVDQYKEPTQ